MAQRRINPSPSYRVQAAIFAAMQGSSRLPYYLYLDALFQDPRNAAKIAGMVEFLLRDSPQFIKAMSDIEDSKTMLLQRLLEMVKHANDPSILDFGKEWKEHPGVKNWVSALG